MPSTPLTCCSIGAATASATSLALAPGYRQSTCTVGGEIWGYCASGRLTAATAPASVITIEITLAKIGRSMKNREIMRLRPDQPPRAGAPPSRPPAPNAPSRPASAGRVVLRHRLLGRRGRLLALGRGLVARRRAPGAGEL